MKYTLIIIALLVVVTISIIVFRSSDDSTASSNKESAEINKQTINYKNILPAELEGLLDSNEDIFLLDVHTPEQKHIDGTDTFIPYDNLENNISRLPKDKNQKIVVYCRSGSMGKIASDKLIELGFTDVSNLEGGIQAWNNYKEDN